MVSVMSDMRSAGGISTRISGPGIGFIPFLVGIGLGVLLGPAIISFSKAGRESLIRTAREAEERAKKA